MYCTYRCTQEGEDINVTNLMSVFEIIGSIAFAISGSMLAIKKEMDLFGILILGIVTSVGGGAIRDIVIGNTPPAMFQNPKCTAAFALSGWFPTILRRPLSASDTLSEATAPVKLPA